MRIVYVAKHGPFDNQDEDAITHALQLLGHEVICIQERKGVQAFSYQTADFCLFHKWEDYSAIAGLRMPRVFWYFDLVKSQTCHIFREGRNRDRSAWFRNVVPHCVAGFCTDGDFVADDKTGKLIHLMQGADERFVGYGTPTESHEILFTGLVNNGSRRLAHFEHLQQKWGNRLGIIGNDGPKSRVHGRALADVLAGTSIAIAPDGPNTDRYWSNRVYLTLGLGGFLLHPYCEKLREHYTPEELVMYRSWEELDQQIEYYINNPEEREALRKAGHEKTLQSHLYRHRIEQLIQVVKERI